LKEEKGVRQIRTGICGEKDRWVEREIVPGTQKITLIITPQKAKDE